MCISDKKDSCLFCFLKIDDAQDLNAKCIRGTANKDMVSLWVTVHQVSSFQRTDHSFQFETIVSKMCIKILGE